MAITIQDSDKFSDDLPPELRLEDLIDLIDSGVFPEYDATIDPKNDEGSFILEETDSKFEFRPNEPVTRLDLARILIRLLNERRDDGMPRGGRLGRVPVGAIIAFQPNKDIFFPGLESEMSDFKKSKVIAKWLWPQGFALCNGEKLSDYQKDLLPSTPRRGARLKLSGRLPALNEPNDFDGISEDSNHGKLGLFLRGGSVNTSGKTQPGAVWNHNHEILPHAHPLRHHRHRLDHVGHQHDVSIPLIKPKSGSFHTGFVMGEGAAGGNLTVRSAKENPPHGHTVGDVQDIEDEFRVGPQPPNEKPMTGPVEEASRKGGENRPQNMRVLWIMRVW